MNRPYDRWAPLTRPSVSPFIYVDTRRFMEGWNLCMRALVSLKIKMLPPGAIVTCWVGRPR